MPTADWKRICCPIDFSDASRAAMEVAADLARRTGAELWLLHAYPVPGYTFPDGSVVASPKMLQDLADGAQRHLDEWRTQAEGLGAPRVETAKEAGEPAAEIVAFARERGMDLLVLGHARAHRARARAHGLHRGARRAKGALPGPHRAAAGGVAGPGARSAAIRRSRCAKIRASERRTRSAWAMRAERTERELVLDAIADDGPAGRVLEGVQVAPAAVRAGELDVHEPLSGHVLLDARAPRERHAEERQPVVDERPGRHRDRPGVTMRKRRNPGVMASRLCASAKNANTSSRLRDVLRTLQTRGGHDASRDACRRRPAGRARFAGAAGRS